MKSKTKTVAIKSEDEATAAMQRIAEKTAIRDKETAEMEEEINEIRSRYKERLSDLDQIRQENFDALQGWAEQNRDEVFGESKSKKGLFGTFGFKLNPPKLVIEKGFDEDEIIKRVEKSNQELINTKKSLDKKSILTLAANDGRFKNKIEGFGLVVEQDEQFFFNPKTEAVTA